MSSMCAKGAPLSIWGFTVVFWVLWFKFKICSGWRVPVWTTAFSWLLGRHIQTLRFDFLSSTRSKFQVRETLVVVNLQAKVAPLYISTERITYYVLTNSRTRDQVSPMNVLKLKNKNKKNKKDHLLTDVSITNKCHLKNKTNNNWRSHF